MEKTIRVIVALILISALGCSQSGGGYDQDKCIEEVQAAFPKALIWPYPEKKYRFIVLDTCGGVYYVKTMGKDTKITSISIIKHCR